MIPNECPSDPKATARLYLEGRLPQAEAAAFEAHFICCPQCSDQLQFTDKFIRAVRRTATGLQPVSPRVSRAGA